jgi:hypothetical protein
MSWSLANSNTAGTGTTSLAAGSDIAHFTFTNAVNSGDVVVVAVATYATSGGTLTSSAVTIADNQGNGNYAQAAWDTAAAGPLAGGIYWKQVATGAAAGAFQVQLSSTTPGYFTFGGGEFSCAGTAAFDAAASNDSGPAGGTLATAGNLPVTGNDLVVAMVLTELPGTVTLGPGLTPLYNEEGAPGVPAEGAYALGVTSAMNPSFTLNNPTVWQAVAVALKEGPGGAPATNPASLPAAM